MWTAAEISAGTARLAADKLTVSDQETLAGIFRLYLKSLAAGSLFSDLNSRLAEAADAGGGKTASKLAATLIMLEENGFDLSELKGGRSGLQTNEAGSKALKIRLSLTLLGYNLPEEFSGQIEAGADESISRLGGMGFPSMTIERKIGW